MKRAIYWVLLAPSLVYLAVFFYAPLAFLFYQSITSKAGGFTLSNYVHVLTSGPYLRVTGYSLLISLTTTVATLVLAYPVSYYLSFVASRREKGLLVVALVAPFWVDFLLRAYALRVFLDPVNRLLPGPLRVELGFRALILGMVYDYLPYMLLPIYAAMEKIPRNLVDAAGTLGAPSHRRLLDIVLPLSLPGVVAGTVLVSLMSFTEFVIPAILGGTEGYTVGYLIYDLFLKYRDYWRGSALTIFVTVTALLAAVVAVRKVGEEVVLG